VSLSAEAVATTLVVGHMMKGSLHTHIHCHLTVDLYFYSFSFAVLFFAINILFIAVYGINSILYQRGLYAPETFTRVQQYGLTLLVTTDDELKKYLNNVLTDVKGMD
jgi:hypothetical protein